MVGLSFAQLQGVNPGIELFDLQTLFSSHRI